MTYPWMDYGGRTSPLKLAVFAALFVPALWVGVAFDLGWLGSRPLNEAIHQLGPRPGRAVQVPADLDRLTREAVPRQGRQHEVEGILGAAAMRGRVRQRADGVDELHDGAGPAMGHDQRQRVLVRRPDVDEVDVHTVDLGRELRKRIEPRLDPTEVVVLCPVAGELLDRRELHALRAVLDELLARPARRLDPAAQVSELRLRDPDLERADGCRGDGNDGLLRSPTASSASVSHGLERGITRCG